MEKFRLFTDKASGINPFTPVRGLERISWPRAILGVFLFVGTIPLAFLIEFFIMAYESTYTLFAAFHAQSIVQALLGPLQWLFTRLYLILMHHSFWGGNYSLYPQRAASTAANEKGKKDEPEIRGGTVLVCNLQSPLDILIVQRLCWSTPLLFAFVAKESDTQKDKTPGIWWTAFRHQAMRRALSSATLMPDSSNNNKMPELVDVTALQMLGNRIGRPVVLFAEGTPSNGRSVLKFPEQIRLDGSYPIIPVGISYLNAAAVNATIPQNVFAYLVRLLGESALSGGNGIDVSLGRPSLLAEELAASRATSSGSRSTAVVLSGDELQRIVAETASFERLSNMPCRTVSLSAADKFRFYDMWQKHGQTV